MSKTLLKPQLPEQSLPTPESNQNAVSAYLNKVRVVMVNTTLPANIGSAARAMWTMGLSDLTVVNPKRPIDDTSVAHAAGAQSVLATCQVVATLDDALNDCQLVFAASSRQRHIPRPVVTPSQAAQIIINQHHASLDNNVPSNTLSTANHLQVAVMFGREDRGLTNDELSLADYHIQIEANPVYPVLNVASAVQVISSFFYSEFSSYPHHLQTNSQYFTTNDHTIDLLLRQIWDAPAISHTQKQQLQTRIVDLMHQVSLIDSTDPEQLRDLPNRLSRLLSRLQLDQKEFELLNAIIAKVGLKL